MALLDYSTENAALARHLQESSKNVIYTSKTIQNDLIDCIGSHIRDNILKEIKEYKYYSILCDELVDISNKEQVSIVMRFVDNKCDIREDFLNFRTVERISYR